MTRRTIWPRSAAPQELKWWDRLSIMSVGAFVGVGAVTTNHRVGGALLFFGGLIQAGFGAALAVNYKSFAERLATYFSTQPLMFGGFFPNRSVSVARVQGAIMAVFGLALAIFGVAFVFGVR